MPEIEGFAFGVFPTKGILFLPIRKLVVFLHIEKTTNKMPKIYEYFGFSFFFFSMEHEPIHVHVSNANGESVFDLILQNGELVDIHVRHKKGIKPLPDKDEKVARAFISKYYKNIVDKWMKVFVLKQTVRTTHIRTKI